jgi:hypothetical protein
MFLSDQNNLKEDKVYHFQAFLLSFFI